MNGIYSMKRNISEQERTKLRGKKQTSIQCEIVRMQTNEINKNRLIHIVTSIFINELNLIY